MIEYKEGNILNATEDILCHQVNCKRVMGAGLALQIKNKYPEVYNEYRMNTPILGDVLFSKAKDGKIIANIYGQRDYGVSKTQTDYPALKNGLSLVLMYAKAVKHSVAIPYNLGCGLAGGDWNIVHDIIDDVFYNYNVSIYKYDSKLHLDKSKVYARI